MGIGGKPATLVNTDLVRKDGTPIVKRFSGGGTVVLDQSSVSLCKNMMYKYTRMVIMNVDDINLS